MKMLSTALLAASLVALSACGGGSEENVAANTAADDLYNVAPDELGTDNLLYNDVLTNETLGNDLNLVDNGATLDNGAVTNTTVNSQ